MIAGYYRIQI